jgi:hypothetical protein
MCNELNECLEIIQKKTSEITLFEENKKNLDILIKKTDRECEDAKKE